MRDHSTLPQPDHELDGGEMRLSSLRAVPARYPAARGPVRAAVPAVADWCPDMDRTGQQLGDVDDLEGLLGLARSSSSR